MGWTKLKFHHVLWLLLWVLQIPSYAQSDSVQMYIRDDVFADYQRFLKDRSPLDVEDFSGGYIRRDVVDMVLIQKALLLGGFDKKFTYQTGNVNFRNTKLLEQGKLLLSFDSYWLADAEPLAQHIYISEAVIRHGQYYAGIFYAPDNREVTNLSSWDDLQALSAVSTPRWRTDWSTLQQLPLKKHVIEHEWVAQARMVSMQWVDFMLMPLMPSKNNEYRLEGIHLVAHPKWVVLLDGSRHFVVSKLHPDGRRAFAALQKGLKELRAKGIIKKAYAQAGFTPDWSKMQELKAQ
ncbi:MULTISPECIES: hypothetical protein [Pseudoalteromonas]|uniref:Solute-binding protein family 3/N-terminal domain-containing protein n=1 Tax=Pseudoalteromonas amylolytica TaxID=1859457 RepID=A0A1S1N0C2_9GAMM|nr:MULTISPECIES: hypothetical protein [Pseudoalteromonas]MCF6435013.1 hypothetical protein [Pseudoalteromonas sp. MMG022]OHU90641.1 hypothetical protein BFC16_03285 [Pseudoalteromonas sp. JW3]OHU92738.1 hypothetical protein BET10_04605 [Pseudoalteromonas amylolytica]